METAFGICDKSTRYAMCKTLIKRIEAYGFEGPIHYTDFDNLEAIINTGYLKSRNILEKEGTAWVDSANQEAIGRTASEVKDFVRFFYFYKTPTLYRFEQTSSKRGSEQVALVFEKDIMSDFGTRFTKRIAAGNHDELYENPAEALFFPWRLIAERGTLPSSYYYYDQYDAKKKLRQAEFLYPEEIAVSRLKAVYFKSDEALMRARYLFGNMPKFKLDLEKKRFNYNIIRNEVMRCA